MLKVLTAPAIPGKITPAEASRLLRDSSADPRPLLEEAARIRVRRTGRAITYSRKVFIPLTNLCRDQCGYCTFARPPEDPRAHTMTPAEVLAVAEAGREAGCKEALFSLGERPELRYPGHKRWLEEQGYASTIGYLAAMCRLVFERTGLLPHANPGTMSLDEMEQLRPYNVSMGMMLESVSNRLLRPGQAHHACPDKVPAARFATLEAAGRLRVPFTTGILIGIGETLEERVGSLFAIRDIHARHGHIQEVIIQNFRAKPDTRFAQWPEPETNDLVLTAALARVIFGPEVNVQIPPNLTSPGFGGLLRAGINDWGGISPVTRDYINPERRWPAIRALRDVTEKAGFELRERLAVYPEFIRERVDFLSELLRDRVARMTDRSGLVRPSEERW
ncbi:MAG: 7,8-didemethyl-8-hydroxy-5-deazariboflavin synthase CofG [Bryobacterales bacterium]|nr:7,8-didemethyl-8-hydroxy-5-deazariboflavin synthase CofG [Bryobacterales bacterium]